ncbi:MAG: hypothetical protein FWG77_00975 [Treponema sp.]|nr:hypothetical protein [Treponema sp.]
MARIEGELMEGGAVELSLRTSLGPRTITLIRSLRTFAGDESEVLLLDVPAIGLSLEAMPGIGRAGIRNTSPSALDGTIFISNISDFLAEGDANRRFVVLNEAAQNSSINVVLDRVTAPGLFLNLSPDILEYFHAIFAPAIQGDHISVQEYLDLLTSIYGRPLADEIEVGVILVQITFPRPIISVRGGTFSGRMAEFSIPLVDFLVLEQPLLYEVRW